MTRHVFPRLVVDNRHPDERLRDLEAQVEALRAARRACPFCASKAHEEVAR